MSSHPWLFYSLNRLLRSIPLSFDGKKVDVGLLNRFFDLTQFFKDQLMNGI